MIKWFVLILLPILAVTIASLYVENIMNFFPSFAIEECFDDEEQYQDHINSTLLISLYTNFIINSLFIVIIYVLRHVQDEFSINEELKYISIIWYVTGLVYYFFINICPYNIFVTSGSVQYLNILRGLLFGCFRDPSNKRSYSPNAIIPFPINEECIKSLEMALLMPTSANYFYNYLENYCADKDALIYFGLYADLRTYMRMCEE